MPTILITCCNIDPPGCPMGALDLATGQFVWAPVDEYGATCHGMTGACRSPEGGFAILTQVRNGEDVRLLRYDDQWRPRPGFSVPAIRDAHSMIPFGEGYLVADSAQNAVVYIADPSTEPEQRLPRGTDQGIYEVYWSCGSRDSDEVHLNSVAEYRGDVYVSMFGPKPAAGWAEAQDGAIENISRHETIFHGLRHPHSLTVFEDELYWLESQTARLYRYTPEDGVSVVAQLEGYLRGLAIDRSRFYIAGSAARRKSRSTGALNASANNLRRLHSWLYTIERDTLEVSQRKLTQYTSEAYDLVRLTPDEAALLGPSEIDPVVHRLWNLEEHYLSMRYDQRHPSAPPVSSLATLMEKLRATESRLALSEARLKRFDRVSKLLGPIWRSLGRARGRAGAQKRS